MRTVIQYRQPYQGIQPYTIIAEHRAHVVRELCKKGIAVRVPADTKTTAEREREETAAEMAALSAAAAPPVETTKPECHLRVRRNQGI